METYFIGVVMVNWKMFNMIEGLMDLDEGKTLFCLAKYNKAKGVILEIGTKHGYSTGFLAVGSKQGRKSMVYTIDRDRSSLIDNKFLSRAGVTNLINFITKDSNDVTWTQSIKLLFIDGSHTYADVRRDYLKYEPYVSKGGIIAIHDCFPIHLPMFYLDVWKGKESFWQGDDFQGGPQRVVE